MSVTPTRIVTKVSCGPHCGQKDRYEGHCWNCHTRVCVAAKLPPTGQAYHLTDPKAGLQ